MAQSAVKLTNYKNCFQSENSPKALEGLESNSHTNLHETKRRPDKRSQFTRTLFDSKENAQNHRMGVRMGVNTAFGLSSMFVTFTNLLNYSEYNYMY